MRASREVFADAIAETQCPFAQTAKLSYAPEWSLDASEDDNFDCIAAALAEFCAETRPAEIHGFVFQVPLLEPTLDCVSRRFCSALVALNIRDPACTPCLKGNIRVPGWQFEFSRQRLFANVFAGCYQPNHSKYLKDTDVLLVFFQPDHSFDWFKINREATKTKESIRQQFAAAGRPYPTQLIDRRIEAELYIFPLEVGDPPVAWFEHLEEA